MEKRKSVLSREDEILKRMLKTPPKPHKLRQEVDAKSKSGPVRLGKVPRAKKENV
jgi:hypothetical protein